MNLLLIDQESPGAEALAQRLSAAGFRPEVVSSVPTNLQGDLLASPVAVLLDQGAKAAPAQLLISEMRRSGINLPLVVLSARDDWRERVASFEAGADDFLIKPVHAEEVAARLRAAIRRTLGASSDRLVLGPLEIDLKGQCAWLDGRCLDLTRNEYRLLHLLTKTMQEGAVSREVIARKVWPERNALSQNAIEVLVARLRAKLGANHIQTLRGMGYRLVIPAGELSGTGLDRSEKQSPPESADPLEEGIGSEYEPGRSQ